jgi:uncharacterized sulfatase
MPLIIHVPEKLRQRAPAEPGKTMDQLVSFVDFGPTVLSLCGINIPTYMQGIPFLGSKKGTPRQFVYGARDRVDEAFDLSRSIHNGRFLYIRNFMPHLSWMQPEAYSDQSIFRQELAAMLKEGKLGPNPLTYASPKRPIEELYDSLTDPYQLTNLATHVAFDSQLVQLRTQLQKWILESRDAGFLTEPQVWDRLHGDTPYALARNEARYPLVRLLESAGWVGNPDACKQILIGTADRDDGIRYWSIMALGASTNRSAEVTNALVKALRDTSAVVRIEAASVLAKNRNPEALKVLSNELNHVQPEVALHAARAIELVGEPARSLLPILNQALNQARQKEAQGSDMAMFIRFSLSAAVSKLQP